MFWPKILRCCGVEATRYYRNRNAGRGPQCICYIVELRTPTKNPNLSIVNWGERCRGPRSVRAVSSHGIPRAQIRQCEMGDGAHSPSRVLRALKTKLNESTTMKTTLKSIAIALSLIAIASLAHAAQFQNGSFEVNAGDITGVMTAAGWVITNGPPIRFLNDQGTTQGAFAALFNPGSGQNGSVLSQTF